MKSCGKYLVPHLHAAICLLAVLLFTGCDKKNFQGKMMPDAFYVWQRVWNSEVIEAVNAEGESEIFYLVAEIAAQGETDAVAVPLHRIREPVEMVPVIRVPLMAFNRLDLLSELVRMTDELRRGAPELQEIQFDLDCPESRLGEYAELLEAYRAQAGVSRISITVLPCHVHNPAFSQLIREVDWFVLQVHGIEVPEHIDEDVMLMDMAVAKSAVRAADSYGTPFRVALPCYAYEMYFNRSDGVFVTLAAEAGSLVGQYLRKRSAAAPADLIHMRKQLRPTMNARGIIWFRLPVAEDRLCLPRGTLFEIQKGVIPENNTVCSFTRISKSTLGLSVSNMNVINKCSVRLLLDWPNPCGGYDLYRFAHIENAGYGMLPKSIVVEMPPPGQVVDVGWFESAVSNRPRCEVELL